MLAIDYHVVNYEIETVNVKHQPQGPTVYQ